MLLRYTGSSDERSFVAADFRSAGVENQNKVVWNTANGKQAEVDEEAGDWILRTYPKDFEQIDEETQVPVDQLPDSED